MERLRVVTHTCNHCTEEVEGKEQEIKVVWDTQLVESQSVLHEFLSQNKTEKHYIKNNKIEKRNNSEPKSLFEKINTVDKPSDRWNRKSREKRTGGCRSLKSEIKVGVLFMANRK